MIELTDWLRAELTRRAEAEAPSEACGLISRSTGPTPRLSLWAAENAAEEPETSFLIAPQSQFDILEQIKIAHQELVGIYHSHPRSAPDLSERDREIAKLWPGLVWVIVGLQPCAECVPIPLQGTAQDNDLIPDGDCEACGDWGYTAEVWAGVP